MLSHFKAVGHAKFADAIVAMPARIPPAVTPASPRVSTREFRKIEQLAETVTPPAVRVFSIADPDSDNEDVIKPSIEPESNVGRLTSVAPMEQASLSTKLDDAVEAKDKELEAARHSWPELGADEAAPTEQDAPEEKGADADAAAPGEQDSPEEKGADADAAAPVELEASKEEGAVADATAGEVHAAEEYVDETHYSYLKVDVDLNVGGKLKLNLGKAFATAIQTALAPVKSADPDEYAEEEEDVWDQHDAAGCPVASTPEVWDEHDAAVYAVAEAAVADDGAADYVEEDEDEDTRLSAEGEGEGVDSEYASSEFST